MSKWASRLSAVKRPVYGVLVAGMLKIIDLSLHMFGYKRVCRTLILLSPRPDPSIMCLSRAISIARFVNRIAQHLGGVPCLRRSLVLWWLLRWRRIPANLVIGVNPAGGHAWIEHHGYIINDRPDVAAKYAVVYSDHLSPEGISILR